MREARDEHWTVRELEQAIRRAATERVVEGQAETMYSVDVTVRVAVEATSTYEAEDQAWGLVKTAITPVPHAHVIASHSQPTVGRRASHEIDEGVSNDRSAKGIE